MAAIKIPYGRQTIDDRDIEAVVEALRSDYLTQGPLVNRFEDALAKRCGARHAVAVANGTAALHAAYAAYGIGPGDIVWTSPISFVATANAAIYLGATVEFIDVDPQTALIDPARLRARLEQAEKEKRLPKLIVPVHFAGRSAAMEPIRALAEQAKVGIIEDAAHSLGAGYADGTPVGSCAYAAACIFSFHPVKPITTGEGGAVLTNDDALATKLRMFRSHGITRDPALWRSSDEAGDRGPWYYEMQLLGFNYRLTDVQSALGCTQLEKLDGFIARRRELAARYRQRLASLPLLLPPEDPHCGWHLYVVQCREDSLPREKVFTGLRARGIGANVHYIPIPAQPYYRKLGFDPAQHPSAQRFYQHAISLPLFPGLTNEEQDQVIAALHEIYGA